MMRAPKAAAAMLVVSLVGGVSAQAPSPFATSPFEFYLDLLRQQAGIPGISAAIVQNGDIVWERGLGFQNVEDRIRATPDTPYPIANLSETLAATLLLECVEQRRVGLDDRASQYGVLLPEQGATIRQILNHTSAATSGNGFHYNPSRFDQLTRVVEWCVPQPYRKTLAVRLLERLAMKDSVPGSDVQNGAVLAQNLFADSVHRRYGDVLEKVAVPYKVDKKGRATRSPEDRDEGVSAAGGVISTVRDLARFDAGLDVLLDHETLEAAWTNGAGRDRSAVPTGLAWFVQRYNGQDVVWHFGLSPNGYSSLILKVPDKELTLILLANSDGLSSSFDLPLGDVTKSLFAILFLRLFV
jgi:CubicO group peptidase (beta-lactamase class C family)